MGWKRGGGREIPNSDIMKQVYELTSKIDNITFKYVKAHTRRKDLFSNGNREADRLAKLGAHGTNTVIETPVVECVTNKSDIPTTDDIEPTTIKVVKRTKVTKKKKGEMTE